MPEVGGALFKAKAAHARTDGARTNKCDFFPCLFQPENLVRQAVNLIGFEGAIGSG